MEILHTILEISDIINSWGWSKIIQIITLFLLFTTIPMLLLGLMKYMYDFCKDFLVEQGLDGSYKIIKENGIDKIINIKSTIEEINELIKNGATKLIVKKVKIKLDEINRLIGKEETDKLKRIKMQIDQCKQIITERGALGLGDVKVCVDKVHKIIDTAGIGNRDKIKSWLERSVYYKAVNAEHFLNNDSHSKISADVYLRLFLRHALLEKTIERIKSSCSYNMPNVTEESDTEESDTEEHKVFMIDCKNKQEAVFPHIILSFFYLIMPAKERNYSLT